MADELIQVITNDKSATVSTSVGSTGATVIKSKRGGNKPVLFYPNSEKRIIDYFGIPDTNNEAVDDVITYNAKYPIWVSAPSVGGRYGGVLVTKTGTKAFAGGKTSKTIDFSAVESILSVDEVPNGTITNFNATLASTEIPLYNSGTVDILVNGVSINVTAATGADPEILTTTPSIGSGTFTKATGKLDFTFTTAPVTGSVIEVTYTSNHLTDTYLAVFNENPQADDLKLKVTKNTDNTFNITLYKYSYSTLTYEVINGYPLIVSTTPNTKDGYGRNIFADVYLEDSDFIEPVANTALAVSTFTDDTAAVAFTGGKRGTTTSAQLTTGWNYFQNANKYKADIFFDTTADSVVPPLFDTLRNSYQKYSYYILPTTNVSPEDAITAYTSLMTDNKGVAFYWGWAKINNAYTGSTISSSLMGRRALRLADMYDVFNGLAPAWYNENSTHGGQLGSVVEMFYDCNDTQQELLHAARINPTVVHPTFNTVLTRERTSQSLQSDYSSIGHVRLADYLISNIISQALPYQLYKLNDTEHRTKVASQIDKIISPVAAEPYNLLRDYTIKCDAKNNNDTVLALEQFIVSVAIKFTPFSKKITLYFTNTAQGTSVSEAV